MKRYQEKIIIAVIVVVSFRCICQSLSLGFFPCITMPLSMHLMLYFAFRRKVIDISHQIWILINELHRCGHSMQWDPAATAAKRQEKHTHTPATLFRKHNKLTRILEAVKQPASKRVVAFPFFTFFRFSFRLPESATTTLTAFFVFLVSLFFSFVRSSLEMH